MLGLCEHKLCPHYLSGLGVQYAKLHNSYPCFEINILNTFKLGCHSVFEFYVSSINFRKHDIDWCLRRLNTSNFEINAIALPSDMKNFDNAGHLS